MAFSLKVGDASVLNLNRFWYDQTLNGIRNFEIVTDANDSTLRSEYSTDKVVDIYRNGTLELKGKVKEANNFQSGGIILVGLGQEKELAEKKCPVDSGKNTKTWTSTSSNTIFNTLVTTASGWSANTAGASSVALDSFRVSKSMSVWNGIIQLLKHINKDIYINDSTKTLYLVNSKNRTGKAIFNEGINCGQVNWSESVPKAAKVEVYGKGDGKNQITGSAGSGTPVHEVIDRNIITTTEANTRAQKELDLIQNSVKHYFFDANNPNEDVELGDTVKLNASSAGLHDIGIDVVRFTRGLSGDSETLTLEVTNPQYRMATKNLYQDIAKSESESITSRSAMQGSGNTLTFSKLSNADRTTPIIVHFYLSADHIKDEAGNLRVDSMTLDYTSAPFRRGVGDSSFDGADPQVQNSSDSFPPGVSGTSGSTTPAASAGVSVWHTLTVDASLYKAGSYSRKTIVGSPSYHTTRAAILVMNITGGAVLITPKVTLASGTTITYTTNYNLANNGIYSGETGESSASNETGWNYFWDNNYNSSLVCGTAMNVYTHTHSSHTHGDGSYAAANHIHANGAYDINSIDVDDLSIGNYISDVGTVWAGQMDIYLDFYENKSITNNETAGSNVVIEMADTGNIHAGDVVYFDGTNKEWSTVTAVTTNTSITATIATDKTAGDKITWTTKHTVLNTGTMTDSDVDITDSETYPDDVGYWRIRILTDNANPDYVQAIVKLKHSLDS